MCVWLQVGIIEEMMDDAFESMEDQDELEEEAEVEVEKVLWELTAGVNNFHYRYISLTKWNGLLSLLKKAIFHFCWFSP